MYKSNSYNKKHPLYTIALSLCLAFMLSACQPKSTDIDKPIESTVEAEEISASASATIAHFKEKYVDKMLKLQNSLQAEHDAIQVADAPTHSTTEAAEEQEVGEDTEAESLTTTANLQSDDTNSTQPVASTTTNSTENSTDNENTQSVQTGSTEGLTESNETDIETASVVPDLPLVNIDILPPEQLTASEIETRYQTAMSDLYTANTVPLSAQSIDTLLSIAMLVPDIFRDDELARRLTVRMPALARLLKQYQIWEQIEAQQSAELQALKQEQIKAQQKQREEFAELMADFDKTIKDYDEQIAKYEQKLKEFE
ncbi:hypothetical protein [Psychrobacter sp. I-STPA6b]|uniref:hypothetical protein n=1 Tax=Psychrobacter sp. I-STPA6b TaxID=2585718 RepID=UPI001D0C7C58|nr:hypothetical protein [Psychrobacter sp. I-STPA6b]